MSPRKLKCSSSFQTEYFVFQNLLRSKRKLKLMFDWADICSDRTFSNIRPHTAANPGAHDGLLKVNIFLLVFLFSFLETAWMKRQRQKFYFCLRSDCLKSDLPEIEKTEKSGGTVSQQSLCTALALRPFSVGRF